MNKIYCIDALEGLKLIEDKSIDLVLTDPPYGVNLEYDNYIDSESNWYNLMEKIMPEIIRVSKMAILPSCQIKKLKWFYDNFPPDWMICWYKGSTGCSAYIGFNDWEPHLVYGKNKSNLFMHDYFQTKPSFESGTFNHPCPKPLEWATWIIERSSDEGNLILDPFVGSGTVTCVCKKLNRNFIGFDISKDYCDVANKRLSETFITKKDFGGFFK